MTRGSSAIAFDYQNHLEKCRICVKEFKKCEKPVKITKIIQKTFKEITAVELNLSKKFSTTICKRCHRDLLHISSVRAEFIESQIGLNAVDTEGELELDADDDPMDFDDEETSEDDKKLSTNPLEEVRIKVEPFEDFPIVEDSRQENKTNQENEVLKTLKRKVKGKNCLYCNRTTKNMKEHVEEVHLKLKRFFCDLCDHSTYRLKDIRCHVLKHVSLEFRQRHECDVAGCGKFYSQLLALKSHKSAVHSGFEETCECGKAFNNRFLYRNHRRQHHSAPKFVSCPFCKKEFRDYSLQTHISHYHSVNKQCCDICGKELENLYKLRSHLKSHDKADNFKCHIEGCTETFKNSYYLNKHVNSIAHKDASSYKCSLCKKTCISEFRLKRHITEQHQKEYNDCPVRGCDHKTFRKSFMKLHLKSHKEIGKKELACCVEEILKMKMRF